MLTIVTVVVCFRLFEMPFDGDTQNPYISLKPTLRPLGANPDAWEVTWDNFIGFVLPVSFVVLLV